MSDKGIRIEVPVHIKRDRRARKVLVEGEAAAVQGSVPRIARLLALANKWERMVRRGQVKDYAEIARRYRISRARVTQFCGLALLPPRTQEAILVASEDTPSVRRFVAPQPLWSDDASSR